MSQLANRQQISAIHVLAGKAGFSEDLRRDFLERETGHRSTKLITIQQAGRVIEKLRAAAGEGPRAEGAVGGLTTPVARKLRALWIAGWNLGLVGRRTDRAMLAFLERQTGVSHTRFLTEPGQATAAIEALKSWLARAGGVVWPAAKDDAAALASRRAVIDAQWARLVALDKAPGGSLSDYAFKVASKSDWNAFAPGDYDAVQALLGSRMRGALAKTQTGDAS
jgi:uncharacterized protein DUF1018